MDDIIMRCDRILPMEVKLPEGYAIRAYQPGDGRTVAELCAEAGSLAAPERTLIALAPDGSVAGAVTAWTDGAVRSLRGLAVAGPHQGRGLGKALCKAALKQMRREDNAAPVWLHALPEHWKAVLLFAGQGFRLQRNDTFGAYENRYGKAMVALQAVVTPEQYAKLLAASSAEVRAADLSAIRYDARGLVPAIAQDAYTGEVLMLAYMNAESLQATLDSGYATYYSRSRQELWRKGATSGHLQRVIRLSYDCDADAILLQVDQTGPACHTGRRSCFFNPVISGDMPATAAILDGIEKTVADRAANPRPGSYTNYLLDKGAEKICKKVGEEATETVIAAMKGDGDALAGEAADLLYHLIVLLYRQGVSLRDVWEVLKKRHT